MAVVCSSVSLHVSFNVEVIGNEFPEGRHDFNLEDIVLHARNKAAAAAAGWKG